MMHSAFTLIIPPGAAFGGGAIRFVMRVLRRRCHQAIMGNRVKAGTQVDPAILLLRFKSWPIRDTIQVQDLVTIVLLSRRKA